MAELNKKVGYMIVKMGVNQIEQSSMPSLIQNILGLYHTNLKSSSVMRSICTASRSLATSTCFIP